MKYLEWTYENEIETAKLTHNLTDHYGNIHFGTLDTCIMGIDTLGIHNMGLN